MLCQCVPIDAVKVEHIPNKTSAYAVVSDSVLIQRMPLQSRGSLGCHFDAVLSSGLAKLSPNHRLTVQVSLLAIRCMIYLSSHSLLLALAPASRRIAPPSGGVSLRCAADWLV
jgi:hypothetical protein